MAVTKRVRFEIFRRDNNACRYCGQTAPEVKLTIDHVVPVALGGDDNPANLVTACFDCNLGKGSTSPDENLVAEVSDETLRFAKLAKQAWAVRVEAIQKEWDFVDAAAEYITFRRPSEWRSSIGRFYNLGVPLEAVQDAARLANDRWDQQGNMDRFRYMCGILWKQVGDVNGAIAEALDMDGCWHTEDDLTNMRIEAYEQGWAAGWHAHGGRTTRLDRPSRLLRNVIEGSHQRVAEKWVDGREALAACG